MGIPLSPTPNSNPEKNSRLANNNEVSLPSLPDISTPVRPRKKPVNTEKIKPVTESVERETVGSSVVKTGVKRKVNPEPMVQSTSMQSSVEQSHVSTRVDVDDDKYGIDSKTGLKYRLLPGVDNDVLTPQRRKNGMTIDDFLKHVEEVEDFSDDLNEAASLFLPHLRVAPDKEEQEFLRQEKARLMREQNRKYMHEHNDDGNDESS